MLSLLLISVLSALTDALVEAQGALGQPYKRKRHEQPED